MYVIRPQFFIPLITFLCNATKHSLEYKKQLECEIENNISSTEINTVCFQYTIPPIRFAVKINNIEPTESVQDTECVIISHVQMVPVKAIA